MGDETITVTRDVLWNAVVKAIEGYHYNYEPHRERLGSGDAVQIASAVEKALFAEYRSFIIEGTLDPRYQNAKLPDFKKD